MNDVIQFNSATSLNFDRNKVFKNKPNVNFIEADIDKLPLFNFLVEESQENPDSYRDLLSKIAIDPKTALVKAEMRGTPIEGSNAEELKSFFEDPANEAFIRDFALGLLLLNALKSNWSLLSLSATLNILSSKSALQGTDNDFLLVLRTLQNDLADHFKLLTNNFGDYEIVLLRIADINQMIQSYIQAWEYRLDLEVSDSAES